MGWDFSTSYFDGKMVLYSLASYEPGQTVLVPRDGGSFDSGGLATKASKVPPRPHLPIRWRQFHFIYYKSFLSSDTLVKSSILRLRV